MRSAPGRHARLQRAVLGVLLALHLLWMPVCMNLAQAATSGAAAQSEAPCPMHVHADEGGAPAQGLDHHGGECHCLTAHCALLGEWRVSSVALNTAAAIPSDVRAAPAFQPERELRPPIR